MKKQAPIRAEVTRVCGEGRNRYAVTRLREPIRAEGGQVNTVTFSLQVWQGGAEPRPGQLVHLSEVSQFARGWRAQRAEPVSLR